MKRFYSQAGVTAADGGFQILLDGKPVRTPAGKNLIVPTRAMADVIAAEWQGQGDEIDPVSMPFLRLADTVIDGIAPAPGPVVDAILRFAENDLLCYRAENPPQLAARQREGWDPLLAWAARSLDAALTTVNGHNHVGQPRAALEGLRARVAAFDAFGLAGLHVIASITGSLVLALALAAGEIHPAQAFALSRIDEDFQAEKWGQDHEAAVRATSLARELDVASAFIAAARDSH